MPTAKLYNLARMTTATTGTGTITLGLAASGFITFAQAGVANGETVTYAIEDGTNREIGRGVYTSAGLTLTRSVLKATPSGGTTPITLSGTAQVFITAAAEDILTSIAVQKFTASGTYTPNANMFYAIVECQGGGGGGGGVVTTSGHYTTASGGGGGAYARKILSRATIGTSQTVMIGAGGTGGPTGMSDGAAGGTTSLGTLCVADGGSGGYHAQSGVSVQSGGAGGATGTGDLVIPGGGGGGGVGGSNSIVTFLAVGWGGGSHFGGEVPCIIAATGISASANSGAGGSGAQDVGTTNLAGGNGGSGVVFITEYCSL